MWLLPETTTPESTAKVGKGWKKYLSSNWRCKKKGYSKLVKRRAQDSRYKCVVFVVNFRGFFSE